MEPPRRRATYADLLAVPETKLAEIIDGELVVSPRPAFPHMRAAERLHTVLASAFDTEADDVDQPGGWWIHFEPELHLGYDILVPDIAGWRRERMNLEPIPAAVIAPDWVCEVMSPGSEKLDRIRKMAIYGREHVAHAWLIEPTDRTLEVFRLEGGAWKRVAEHRDDAVVRAAPFEAIELRMARWWIPQSA